MLRDVIGCCPVPALALDDNFTLLTFNAEMEALTGYKQEEAKKIGITAYHGPGHDQ